MGLRVLLLGDAGAETGFARANHGLGERLVRNHGHDVHVLAVNWRGDHPDTPLKLYLPTQIEQRDLLGRTRIIEMLGKVEPDVVWITNDPFVILSLLFKNPHDPERILLRYRPLVTYQPRDGTNPPRTWDGLREIKTPNGTFPVSRQVAMTRFGQEQMPDSELVSHGVDPDIFYPASRQRPIVRSDGSKITTKREAKESFGYPPDSFLVLRVDRNSWRKDFASTIKAMVPVILKHDDVFLHLHCAAQDDLAGGVSILPFLSRFDLPPGRVRLPDPEGHNTFTGWAISDLAALYNAADVFITNSMGEGWGLTIGEALASGVPVVAQKLSSIPEVVGPGGMLLDPAFTVTAPGGQDFGASDIGAFTEAIEHLYRNDGFRKRYGRAGMQHVIDSFNWDVEAAKLSAILEDTVATTELTQVPA